jgi:hypothetical protein
MRLRDVVLLVLILASCGQVESDPAPVPPPPCTPLPLGSYSTTFRRVAGDCGAPRVSYPACSSGVVDYRECGETSVRSCEGATVVEDVDYRAPRLLRQTWTYDTGCVEEYEVELREAS